MRHLKFSGVLEEIIEQYPNLDIVEFLQEKLQIPQYKAEELAARIEKEYCLKGISKNEQNLARNIWEKQNEPEHFCNASVYSVECLSEREFGHFMKWLLEKIDYKVHPEKYAPESGVDFVATKDGEKIAIQARRFPKTSLASNSIVSKSEQTKQNYGCDKSLVIATTHFSQQAIVDAEKLGVELWDVDTLETKIANVRKNADLEEQSCFQPYKGSLLQSLLRLEETKDFIIEPRANEKYDLHLPGVKFPLLTFQVHDNDVIQCIYRIKYNEPVGESGGEPLIKTDHNNDRFGPDGIDAYTLIIQYLEQFVE
jgi:hypothetical protein